MPSTRVCPCVCAGACSPGAGCGSENPLCSSCYIRVSPFLIWELKIARAKPCPSGLGATGSPTRHPSQATALPASWATAPPAGPRLGLP